jgi:diguanylate cyclase (GGDEF)-like protein/putative nucleotidyltransferase with HDIG domain
MRSLPRKAQVYLILVYCLGILAVICVRGYRGLQVQSQGWELFLFAGLAVLAGSKKICLMRHTNDEDVGSMSLGFCITFAAMLRCGPAGGLLTGCISCLSGCLYPKMQSVHQLAFNVALSAVEAWLASLVFLALNGWTLLLHPVNSFPAIIGSSLTCYLTNTGGVAVIIAICTGQLIPRLWKETFLWTAPSYFAGACLSALALLIFGNHIATALLFLSPVIYLIFQSYAIYTARAEEKQKHIEELQLSQAQLADLYLATIKSLALAIDAKDQYTHQHILRVQRYAVATAKQLGLTGAELEGVNTGALLHDIGKLGVPEYVLLKPGRLTDEEFAKIKKHPEIGASILDPVEFPWPVLPVVKYHHEKWDGTGYPEGLKGEEIPLTARILAVGDVYDALTSTRSYRNAWSHEKAIAVIKKDSGTHFDPVIVEAFLQIIEDVVAEMAKDGEGPLAQHATSNKPATSKAAQAVRDIQRSSSELWALYEVAQTLSSSLGLQETIDILARKLEAIFPGVACLFLLRSESDEALHAHAVVGLNQEFFKDSSTLNAKSRSLQVMHNRETYVGEYDQDDLMLTSSPSAQWTKLESALIVPIVHEGEVLGTINLYHEEPHAFGPHDRQLLETIAERAAMALRNGLLFDRTRSHAFTDPLTGVYNIRYLTQYVEDRCKELQRRHKMAHELGRGDGHAVGSGLSNTDGFALLCLDLDSFKPINDNFGHQKGDQVLCELAHIFQNTVRDQGIVARYGGDEFLIVLEGAGLAEAENLACKLQAAVEGYDADLVHYKLGALRLGASIGFACFPLDGQDCTTLMATADTQMYRNKTERKLGNLVGKDRPIQTEQTLSAPSPARAA